jgi:hypothetical protein
MLVYSVYFRRKEQQTFQKEEQNKHSFFPSFWGVIVLAGGG